MCHSVDHFTSLAPDILILIQTLGLYDLNNS